MITRTFHSNEGPAATGYLIPGKGSPIEVSEFLSLGRDSANGITLEDNFVSARHARIERRNGGFWLRDLRSRNGTYVNGVRVLEAALNDGDRVRVGESEYTFSHEPSLSSSLLSLKSKSPIWNAQLERLPSIAASAFPVLLSGPSGSGKDVLARSIHELSARAQGPFVSVNCSALTESLVESELFGHIKGSYTGAADNRKGAFEAARGGTLFLDEVGDLPLNLQPKLLRALENNEIRPVGSDRVIKTDVRVVSATHKNLKLMVQQEHFRQDLFFRLHVVEIKVPALLERRADFDDLFYQFARQFRVRFSHGAIMKMKAHSWPGNIRELRNAVARAKALFGSSEVLDTDVESIIDHLPQMSSSELRTSRSVVREIEKEMIKARLVANHGNQRKTAMDLGMPKSTLNDRIRTLGIDISKLT